MVSLSFINSERYRFVAKIFSLKNIAKEECGLLILKSKLCKKTVNFKVESLSLSNLFWFFFFSFFSSFAKMLSSNGSELGSVSSTVDWWWGFPRHQCVKPAPSHPSAGCPGPLTASRHTPALLFGRVTPPALSLPRTQPCNLFFHSPLLHTFPPLGGLWHYRRKLLTFSELHI